LIKELLKKLSIKNHKDWNTKLKIRGDLWIRAWLQC